MARVRTLLIVSVAIFWAAAAQAQEGRLILTVTDQLGGVLPGATVTLTGEEAATTGRMLDPVVASEAGIATLVGVPQGRYTVTAEFPGLETAVVRGVRVSRGDTRRTVVLKLEHLETQVMVGRDGQTAGLDPRGNAFSTVMTREQIDALPDDPEEMERVLQAMAPPGATIRIDGFNGGRLPAKSQIRSIRLPRMDQTAAQNHGGMNGMMFIDIMTQPGSGPLRGSTDLTFLSARNPFAPVKGDEALRQFGGSLSGTVVENKSSFSVSVQGTSQHETSNLLAALPGGFTQAEAVRRPRDSMSVNGRFDTAISRDHTLRANVIRSTSTSSNLGVGDYNLPERGYSRDTTDTTFRLSENGPLGRRFFSESRLQVRRSTNESTSAVEAPTLRVLEAFTSGGAQQQGGRRSIDVELSTDLDYVRGNHSFRTGVLVEGGRYTSDDSSNYLGTYTFASLDAYLAGQPTTFTRRVGDPTVRYTNLQAGLYAQDDFRLSQTLLLSYGVRYEAQTLIKDQQNISPRVSLSWSPTAGGRTTFRGGWGRFSDWLGTNTYEQTLRVDGVRQREVQILNPTYPAASDSGITPPTNKYLLGNGIRLPESDNVNLGVDQMLNDMSRISATYTYRRGSSLLRGSNLNAPVDGVRPDPAFSNIVEVQTDAASRSHALSLGGNLMFLNWHRTMVFGNYTLTRSESNTSGAFSLPANGNNLSTEWGLTAPRHRFNASVNTQLVQNLSLSLNLRGQSGSPYNVTSGLDTNKDGLFNDRPDDVARNSGLTAGQWDIGGRLSYALGFGPSRGPSGPGGIAGLGGPIGDMAASFLGGMDSRRYRLEFFLSGQNLTNHRNYVGYSGTMTSPFFGQPTSVMNPRRLDVGMRFGF
jgi:hypothetical protein